MNRHGILRRTGRSLVSGVIAGMLAVLAGTVGWQAWREKPVVSGQAVAIDGDSLRVGGAEVRLAGIDAPEYRQTCSGPRGEEPCGHQAREALVALLAGPPPVCTVVDTDRYHRQVALCRVGQRDINRDMVLAGRAIAFGRYEKEEEEARLARRGIWATRFERPADWRAHHPRAD